MSGKSLLLDTNIIIDIFIGNDETVKYLHNIDNLFISAISLGELYFGAENSLKKKKHFAEIDDFLTICKVLAISDDAARFYGEIKQKLKKNGTPIPENDIWIAAVSMENNIDLITKDKHFSYIDGLKFNLI